MRQSVFRIQKFGSEFKILFKCLFQISDKVSSEKSRVPSPLDGLLCTRLIRATFYIIMMAQAWSHSMRNCS